jgi:DNA-binding NarL/FixJ family response regulator
MAARVGSGAGRPLLGDDPIAALRRLYPGHPVLVYTVQEDSETLLSALRAGAQGYLLKGSSAFDVTSAMRAVVNGDAPLSPEVARHVLGRVRGSEPPDAGAEPPTPRQMDVLRLLAHGHSYSGIAEALGLSLSTVQSHVRGLYEKLGVASKAEATLVAIRHGWLG